MDCKHSKTHYEDWPDGGAIEVCDSCGMSRYHSEFDTTGWINVDIPKAREDLEKAMRRMCPRGD